MKDCIECGGGIDAEDVSCQYIVEYGSIGVLWFSATLSMLVLP